MKLTVSNNYHEEDGTADWDNTDNVDPRLEMIGRSKSFMDTTESEFWTIMCVGSDSKSRKKDMWPRGGGERADRAEHAAEENFMVTLLLLSCETHARP